MNEFKKINNVKSNQSKEKCKVKKKVLKNKKEQSVDEIVSTMTITNIL